MAPHASRSVQDLEEQIEEDDAHEEELHEEIDELQLQVRVTEAHRDDLLSVSNEKAEEIATLKENIEREKQYVASERAYVPLITKMRGGGGSIIATLRSTAVIVLVANS